MREKSLSFNLEPTFRCNLGCEMCPRFSSEDPHLDMSERIYERIRSAMVYAHTVDFTGWGEPMLHPRIYEMVAQAKEMGCLATMTSNGTIFNERNSLSLIEAGMDRLTVSVDGMSPETFDAIRIGASFERVTANLQRLTRLVGARNSPLQLGIAFTIQESNAFELEEILPWMNRVGAQTLHIKQLNVISNSDDWNRSFLKYRLAPRQENGDRLSELEGRIEARASRAEDEGLEVLIHSEMPLQSRLVGRHCLATPLESVYFSFEGRMAPCCHFGHHVSRFFEGRFHPPSALFFGDIGQQDFLEVWNSAAFYQFRDGFEKEDYPEECRTCYLLYGK